MIENGNEPTSKLGLNGAQSNAADANVAGSNTTGLNATNGSVSEQQALAQEAEQAMQDESTGGAMLRAAREHSGTHVNTLAATLKVNVKVLEALEADDYDALPSIPFARALAASICRHLNIDSKPVLDLLPSAQPHPVSKPRMQNAVVIQERRVSWFSWLKHPLTWLVGLGILAGVAFWIAPYILEHTTPEPLQSADGADTQVEEVDLALDITPNLATDAGTVSVAPMITGVAVGNNTTSTAPNNVSASQVSPAQNNSAVPSNANSTTGVGTALIGTSAMPATANNVSAPSPLASDLDVSNVRTGQSVTAVPTYSAAQSAAPIPADAGLVLQATAESWVEVRNGRGKVLHSQTLQPGEVLVAAGNKPYRVVLGKKENVRVYSQGQPYAYAGSQGAGVAKFRVR